MKRILITLLVSLLFLTGCGIVKNTCVKEYPTLTETKLNENKTEYVMSGDFLLKSCESDETKRSCTWLVRNQTYTKKCQEGMFCELQWISNKLVPICKKV
jgi:hypothetical protein